MSSTRPNRPRSAKAKPPAPASAAAEPQPFVPPEVSQGTIINVLQGELAQVQANRLWLLARNADLEAENAALRAQLSDSAEPATGEADGG